MSSTPSPASASTPAASTGSQALLEVHNLHKSYGAKRVLRGIDFDLAKGDSLVILGRSGSGKSVTLRQLNGLEHPEQGSVVFDGLTISEMSERELRPVRKRIAMLFQSGALFDSMSVFENIAFPLREHTSLSEEEIAQAVADKLSRVRLSGIEKSMPSDLSGGMRKRVALARSLAMEPELILYDEPTTGLDPVTSAVIADLIVKTREELGVTSVVVTHDLPLARAVGERIAFVDEGRFRFLGTWKEAEASGDQVLSDFLAGRAVWEGDKHAAA